MTRLAVLSDIHGNLPALETVLVDVHATGRNTDLLAGDVKMSAADPPPVLAEFERQGFVEACGVIGALVMEEYRHARLEVPPFLRWRQATCPDAPFSLDLLPEYAGAGWRQYCPAAYLAAFDARMGEKQK